MSNATSFRRSQTDLGPSTSNPMRHDSTASTVSSAYTVFSNSDVPSRTSTISSNASSLASFGHRRGKSELGTFVPTMATMPEKNVTAAETYGSIRRSLRPLPQAPNSSPKSSLKETTNRHARSYTIDETAYRNSVSPVGTPERRIRWQENEILDHQSYSPTPPRPKSQQSQNHFSPHPPTLTTAFTAPELETFQKSSTGHLRTLSKFAKSGETDEFAIDSTIPSVVGLQGRRRLKRSDSVRGTPHPKRKNLPASSWAAGNWMDKQRQFLQAYEYLCHIGEAKEWIEDVIQKEIPPIVQLEETLRDGVTLAEIVQSLYPNRMLRIFRHPKLQYRHSDNIALFNQFLDEVALPDIFRFELIDLYEKKNIPKVIHCIHALSWLLFKNGIVDFRIGNLVGQLEFEHHELEQTQKCLDKSGVSMPSFSGMGATFGAEPEPEPEPEPPETEEERIERELHENETSITDLQTQIRGAVLRIQLGQTMNQLWDNEHWIVDLQSRVRGDWARQIIGYRLSMRQFAVSLQAISRGYIVRARRERDEKWWRRKVDDVLRIQSLVRGRKTRSQVEHLKTRIRKEVSGIKTFQSAIRGALQRKQAFNQVEQTRGAESEIMSLQAAVRGMQLRSLLSKNAARLRVEAPSIVFIQSAARALMERARLAELEDKLQGLGRHWSILQSSIRGRKVRKQLEIFRSQLSEQRESVILLQSAVRAKGTRSRIDGQMALLKQEDHQVTLLQSGIRGMQSRHQVNANLQGLRQNEKTFITLQSLARAAMARKDIGQLLYQLDDCDNEIIQLQALARAVLVRLDVGNLLSDLEAEEDIIVNLQACIRGSFVRQAFAEKQRFFRQNMEKVIKVQSFVRGKIQGQAYKSLTSGKNPPVGTIKGFVHLLNDSDFDFDQEIEFERLRKTVVQQVRQNEMADQYVTQLDIKIALLVKNKITLDEVVKHQKHFGGHFGSLLSNSNMSSRDPFDLKALNKNSRKKLEQYQVLFFLLQTQPQYLARLFRKLREQNSGEKEYERTKHLIMGLFGYSQKRREEYYLIKLIVRSIKEEIQSCPSLQDWVRCNSFWIKLFTAYVKSPRDRKFLREVLNPLVNEWVLENSELDLESDPVQIYRSAVSNEELRTGHRSRRPLDVPTEVAIRDPETRAIFIQHLQDLRDITDQFLGSFQECLLRMPFGIRYIAKELYECLLAQYTHEDPGFILQVAGQCIWKNYFQSAVLEPEKHGVIDRGLNPKHKKNLGEISKVLSQVASGRLFGNENVYLQPLNNHVGDSILRLGEIWGNLISVQDAESYFDIDEFNDLYAKTKPTLYIKMSDIFSIHQLVANDVNFLCTTRDDFLKDIIRELGNVKSNESELMTVSTSEISLTLHPRLANTEDPEASIKTLFMETKRCILYIIRVQSGANLMDVMLKPPTEEDEQRWMSLVHEELSTNNKRKGAYSEANTLLDLSTMSYADLKSVALENILQLEAAGKINRHNQYQDILNAIAVDIRTKHRRRIQRERELESARLTSSRLNDQAVYLEQQLKTYNDYIEQAMITLQNKKGKKRFLLPFTKQWDHERELQKTGRVFKFGSYKYSARNLADKGVLVQWKGYTERQWDRVDLTISSNEVGIFTLDGSSGNMMIPGANAQVPLDDLLQAQFNNTQFLDFFEGCLRVNVNLFLHLIMKKFYNE
ncbi:putative ras GTPase activating protein [Talaromyces proteolyticus]|uniref:Ras GTPase activating protein n=1 Tax=Talaromyces proteolyticus TaxID=1131652 RepID=A0AAD4PXX0_9EURO|nr:putative ras GTPase activating protein [Talaromyces proteolyticus]KAH8693789.1 putative ras GTPase activating protein [Talaromyces proteolyticus]